MVTAVVSEPTMTLPAPLQPFSSSLGPDLATPTTLLCCIDPLRDTVEKNWPMRHVGRAKVGLDIIKEDRKPGVRQLWAYEDEENSAKPDRGVPRGDSTTYKTQPLGIFPSLFYFQDL